MRIGHGFDVHKFGGNGPCMLGGVAVPHNQGLIAHSDGDVVLHAVCDALLGSLAMGDIGQLYPDTAEEYKGIDSMILLRDVFSRITQKGYKVINVDVTIIAQAPKMAPYERAMRKNICASLNLSLDDVSVKASTTEKLGFVGRMEGIACEAVCLVDKLAD